MTPRIAAVLAFVALGGSLLAVVILTTPWSASGAPLDGQVAPSVTADFTAAQISREKAFHAALRPWSLTAFGLGIVVAVVLGLTPLGARLVELVARPFGGGWVWQAVLGGVALATFARIMTLPFSLRAEVLLRRYGLSTQDWSGWWSDVAKAWGISTLLTAGILVTFYVVVRGAPRWWWGWVAAGGVALTFALSFLYPLVIEPLFNKFTPMPDSPLRTQLVAMAATDRVPVRDVLVADASRRTTALNAYVSGYGASRRLVVYDTLLRDAPAEEVKLVVAHELGHAKRRDILWGTAVGALGAATAVCGGYLLFQWGPLLRRAGVTDLGDPRSIALILAVISVAGFLALPLQNLISRRIEARADRHALELTREPEPFVNMQRRLAVQNLSDLQPNPVLYVWFFSHPTAPERIAQARAFALAEGLDVPRGGR